MNQSTKAPQQTFPRERFQSITQEEDVDMKNILINALCGLPIAGALMFVRNDASANAMPGITFSAGSSESCFIPYNTGAKQNNCGSARNIYGFIPNYGNSPVTASALISNLSSCQATVTNGVGNLFWSGPQNFGTSGSVIPQELALGTPPVVSGFALLVTCNLQNGQVIAKAYQ
jgi:hypothetical protein